MVNHIFIFIVALFMIIKGATLATRYAVVIAESYQLSKYTVGFIVIAVISILPETFIALNSAIEGISSFGLGTLFGSNIADLTVVFATLVFLGKRSIKIESKILKNHTIYPFILLLPIILGFNGHFSRVEGLALIISGTIFYYLALKKGVDGALPIKRGRRIRSGLLLLGSMALLLIGSHFIVTSASAIALNIGVSPILIGMLVVGLGTTIPEFLFSYKSIITNNDDSLAVGDILGTVLADATIVVGILAMISPFSFPQKIVFITGTFMVGASFVLFYFMKTGKKITKREAFYLLAFWFIFVITEFFVAKFVI